MVLFGAFNATELFNDPINYLLTVFTNLMGQGFLLIPVSVITGALWLQKKDPTMTSMFMIVSGALLSGGSLWTGYSEMAILYTVFAGIGIGALILSLYFGR